MNKRNFITRLLSSLTAFAGLLVFKPKARAADIQEFSITEGNPKALVLPRFTISCKVQNGSTVLFDFTGQNAIQFPEVIGELNVDQRWAMMQLLATWLVQVKAGLIVVDPKPE